MHAFRRVTWLAILANRLNLSPLDNVASKALTPEHWLTAASSDKGLALFLYLCSL
jgi:hypothetical protein